MCRGVASSLPPFAFRRTHARTHLPLLGGRRVLRPCTVRPQDLPFVKACLARSKAGQLLPAAGRQRHAGHRTAGAVPGPVTRGVVYSFGVAGFVCLEGDMHVLRWQGWLWGRAPARAVGGWALNSPAPHHHHLCRSPCVRLLCFIYLCTACLPATHPLKRRCMRVAAACAALGLRPGSAAAPAAASCSEHGKSSPFRASVVIRERCSQAARLGCVQGRRSRSAVSEYMRRAAMSSGDPTLRAEHGGAKP